MSLQYLLDGYNIIHQIPNLSLEKLEVQRETLLKLISVYAPQGSFKNKVTVVFDGQAGISYPAATTSTHVIFSRDESADDVIKRCVDESQNSKNMIVVTDDRSVQYAVRALGAKVMSVKDFLSKIKTVKSKATKETKYISKSVEWGITAELERLWLKK